VRIGLAIPDAHVTPEALDSVLEAVTRTDEQIIGSGKAPLAAEAIKRGVRWSPEPIGEERFDNASTVLRRGWGDCDDLAPYHAASLRVTGVDPGAIARVIKSGPNTWHALVQRSDGSIDDPSMWAGMPMPHPARPAVTRAVNGGKPGVVAVHRIGAWYARADLPIIGSPWCLSGTAASDCAEGAVEQAIVGVCGVGTMARMADQRHVQHLFDGLRRRGWGRP
jgi:hypothetical protein